MDVILKQSGNNVGLYIDNKLATVFKNKSIDQVSEWTKRILKYVTIHIVK